MSKLPKQYQAPLRTRKAIINWLNNDQARSYEARGGSNYEVAFANRLRRGLWLFCFKVKLLSGVASGFEELLKLALRNEVLTLAHNNDKDWLKAARQRHEDTNMEGVYEHAIENCQEQFVSCYDKRHLPGNDGYRMLPDGNPVDARFAFMGRSGGWLTLVEFEGHRLDVEAVGAARTWESWDFQDLRKLYRYLVMLEHDLRLESVRDMVESEMAGSFFSNVCHDLPLTVDLKGEGI